MKYDVRKIYDAGKSNPEFMNDFNEINEESKVPDWTDTLGVVMFTSMFLGWLVGRKELNKEDFIK